MKKNRIRIQAETPDEKPKQAPSLVFTTARKKNKNKSKPSQPASKPAAERPPLFKPRTQE